MKSTLCNNFTAAISILAFVLVFDLQTDAQTVEKLIIHEI